MHKGNDLSSWMRNGKLDFPVIFSLVFVQAMMREKGEAPLEARRFAK